MTEGTFKSSDDQGVLQLGNLSQNYISDPDLRVVLANADLDANKMRDFEDQDLLLATSVIYSDKFVLKGKRMRQVSILYNICCVTSVYLVLTEFEGRTISYGPSFFPFELWPKREARGPYINRRRKN